MGGELLVLAFRVSVGSLFRNLAGTIQHIAVVELQEGVQLLGPVLQEDFLSAACLILGEVQPHCHDAIKLADLWFAEIVLRHGHVGLLQKADVTVAKNYLREPEIGELNRIVTMWLDFAEDQARRRKEVFLKDWAEKLDAFLKFNDRDVLDGAGQVSKKRADAHAESQYEQFAAQRRAMLEAEGAEVNVRALEAAAKALPKLKSK